MCGVVEAAAIAGAVTSAYAMRDEAAFNKASNAHQARVQARNNQIAADSFNSQSKAVNERLQGEREAAAAKLAEVNRRGLQASGALRASAGGMGGNSLQAAYQQVQRQELDYRFNTERSLKSLEVQSGRQLEAIRAGRAGQELRGVYTPAPMPNFLLGLGRIGAVAGGAIYQTSK